MNGSKMNNVDDSYDPKAKAKEVDSLPSLTFIGLAVVAILSIVTLPSPLQPPPGQPPTLLHVWYYGWITALSTGIGVFPLFFTPKLDSYYIGLANAFAAGMMIAASYSLFTEGCTFEESLGDNVSTFALLNHIDKMSLEARTALGAITGLLFILATKQFLDHDDDDDDHAMTLLRFGESSSSLNASSAKRALLIFCVMTLHSFAEGVGIGVSFGDGCELGVFISASLAIHNVPEGLAIAVALLPQIQNKTSGAVKTIKLLACVLYAILTSIPQPIMAVPAFLFVNAFIPILPIGLGFAGGAMAYVAFFELLAEAYEDTKSFVVTGAVSTCSLLIMLSLQGAIDHGSRSQ